MESRNFEFLRRDYPELAQLGGFAELYTYSDPVGALVKLRTFAEGVVKIVFAHHQLEREWPGTLNDLLHDASFKAITPRVVLDKLHWLRIKGNHAAHGTLRKDTEKEVPDDIKQAHDLGRWLMISTRAVPASQLPTWQELPCQPQDNPLALRQKNKAAEEKLKQQEALMAKLLSDLEEARAQAQASQKSRAELEQILKNAQQAAHVLDFSEEETRLKLIDEQLLSAGWKVGVRGQSTAEVGQEVEIGDQPTRTGKGFIDYVLYDPESGSPLAIVEAKKTAEDAEKGKMQARYYADGMEKRHGVRPVIFYTNGYEIFIWNDKVREPPRMLFGFYSRDSLQYLHFQNNERICPLAEVKPEENIIDRLYQIEAIKRVTENFDARRRKALIIQATGTGKTRVAIALAEVMIRARWAKRILFLCDRKELRKQARDAFEEFLPGEPRMILNSGNRTDRNQRIYLATYPAMMQCFSDFDVGFFDLIIADESHRSIYNRYRDLFRWFDAYQVGLTATPVKFVVRNTYRLFECENEDPTFHYPYEVAVNHAPPYLCPFKAIQHTTKFLRDGIKYSQLSPEQREQLEEQVDDPESVDFDKDKLAKSVFNEDTDRRILRNLMEKGLRNGEGTRIGKSIIFARNHTHAKQLVSLFDKMYPQYGGDFCLRIDNYEPRAEQLIDDFKTTDSSKNLTIAVSVDMLDTGIDVPEIVNLVFAKPVKSYTKFWQMIGRGTRLCPNLFGPGRDKTVFYIFDHFGNFDFFEENGNEAEPSPPKSLTQTLFEARIKLAEATLQAQDLAAFKIATALIAADLNALPENCLTIRENWRDLQNLKKEGVLAAFQPATVALLRDPIAPLMQWRDVRGFEAALRFDELLASLQAARLTQDARASDLQDRVIAQVSTLPINLRQVAEKLPFIEKAKSHDFHQGATFAELEEIRVELRGIMKFCQSTTVPGNQPLFLNLPENAEDDQTTVLSIQLTGQDLTAYRSRVESVLRQLLKTNPALRKIRTGQAVPQQELLELTEAVSLIDPGVQLHEILIHFPNKAQNLATAIRQIIGMDPARVDQHFRAFVQKYPTLNANQIRFLELLKGMISRFGAIEPEKLWDNPFTTIHAEGIDGVFPDSKQVDDLLALLTELNEEAV